MATSYSDDDVRAYIRAMGWADQNGVVKAENAQKIYDAANTYKIDTTQLNRAMGWTDPNNNANTWITGNNKAPLTGTAPATTTPAPPPTTAGPPAPTPAGSPAPTPAPAGPAPVAPTQAQAISMGDISSMIQSIMAGVNAASPPPPPAPALPPAWQPTQQQLDGISAESRIPGLLSGAVAQRAGEQALAGANRRGLLNSTMALESSGQAMLSEASNIASGDAGRFLSLTQSGLDRDFGLEREAFRAGIDERMEGIRDRNTTRRGLLDFALDDQRDVRDSNVRYARERADTADERAYQDGVSERDWSRERTGIREGWARADQVRDADWAREDRNANRNLENAARTAYVNGVNNITTDLATRISQIQNSDLPPDVKQAQIAAERAAAPVKLRWFNELAKMIPGWKQEWEVLELEDETV
ncbi:hypothetical protein UFOVP707_46 [uncultured Caudovirales phage]|uniref:Uncharacterized protein n=1 Tax=uncultured Caudovirales phage TaxID=2100421 RepID=A0A6J5NNT4_9CAUD|nr:hypothetical protein UFOVP707_46 [uncultured Caudovirales phage]